MYVLMLKSSLRPMGKLLTCLARLSLAQLRLWRSGELQGVRAAETLKVPITPHGKLTICSLFAGRRCLGPEWHSGHIIVRHQWEHSLLYKCASSYSKFPIAPMGRWLTCPNRLSSFHSDRYLVLSGIRTCQPRLQTSHRPDGRLTFVLLVVCRVVVSLSTVAQWPSHRAP